MNKNKEIIKLVKRAEEVVGIKMPNETTTVVDFQTFLNAKTRVYYYDDVFYRQAEKKSLEWLKWTNRTKIRQITEVSEIEELKKEILSLKKWAVDMVSGVRKFEETFKKYVDEENAKIIKKIKQ